MSESKERKTVTTETVETIYLQFRGKEASLDSIKEAIRKDYDATKKGTDAPVDIKIYLKPEDLKAYYVINNDYAGELSLPFE